MEYIIALGANLGRPRETFAIALRELEESVGSVIKQSSWHETEPLLHPISPVPEQSKYLNGVVIVESTYSPEEVLHRLFVIEKKLGRIRSEDSVPWSPRLIDLDIIAAEDVTLETNELTIPHPEMHKRRFVLEPMLEVADNWVHPTLGKDVRGLLNRLLINEIN